MSDGIQEYLSNGESKWQLDFTFNLSCPQTVSHSYSSKARLHEKIKTDFG